MPALDDRELSRLEALGAVDGATGRPKGTLATKETWRRASGHDGKKVVINAVKLQRQNAQRKFAFGMQA